MTNQESLRLFPLPMARFGTNPYGESLFRIVLADSRRSIIHGNWGGGSQESRLEPRYPHLAGKWVMERWLPAEEFAQCSPAVWARTLSVLGPYPTRGEYELCHVFEASLPDDSNVEKLIGWIEAGRKRSFAEVKAGCVKSYEDEQADIRRQQYDIVYDAMTPFLDHPMVGYGGGRNTKNPQKVRSANELNLPTGNNKFTAGNPTHE